MPRPWWLRGGSLLKRDLETQPVTDDGVERRQSESIVCLTYPDCDRKHAGGMGGTPVHPPIGARVSGDEPLIPDTDEEQAHE